MVPRQTIERLWSLGKPTVIAEELKLLREQQILRSLVARVEDILERLPTDGDTSFWCALATFLIRDTDWIEQPEDSGSLASDAADVLFRMGLRNNKLKSRVRSVVDALILQGDLILVPFIIRRLSSHFGYSEYSTRQRDGDLIYSQSEAMELVTSEVQRYKEPIKMSGTHLSKNHSPDNFCALKL